MPLPPRGRGFDQHRKPNACGLFLEQRRGLIFAVIARHERHAGLLHQPLRRRLVAHCGDGFWRSDDEDDACALACSGEVLVFRKEAVAGMDRLGAALLGGGQDGFDVEVALGGRRRPMRRLSSACFTCKASRSASEYNRHRADAHPPRCAHDAAGDLAAIGDQDFPENHFGLRFSRNDAMPSLLRPTGAISAMRRAVSPRSVSSSGRPATWRIRL